MENAPGAPLSMLVLSERVGRTPCHQRQPSPVYARVLCADGRASGATFHARTANRWPFSGESRRVLTSSGKSGQVPASLCRKSPQVPASLDKSGQALASPGTSRHVPTKQFLRNNFDEIPGPSIESRERAIMGRRHGPERRWRDRRPAAKQSAKVSALFCALGARVAHRSAPGRPGARDDNGGPEKNGARTALTCVRKQTRLTPPSGDNELLRASPPLAGALFSYA